MRKKIYLLAGGPGKNGRLAEQLAEALRGSGAAHPAVAYIGTASGDDRSFMNWFWPPLSRAGAASLTLAPLAGKRADPEKAAEILRASDVIFVSGGEVEDAVGDRPGAGVGRQASLPRGERFEHLCARLGSASGDQVLVAVGAGAVGQVNVR